MRLGIAMTTFDAEDFLEEQLRSIAEQTRLPDVLVVADDASSDRTLEILDRFRIAMPFEVIILRGERRLGLHRNFTRALSRVVELCDVAFFSDDDDVWVPEKMAVAEAAFVSNPRLTFWCSDAALIDERGEPLGVRLFDTIAGLDAAAIESFVSGGGTARLVRGETMTGGTIAVRADAAAIAVPVPADTQDGWPIYFQDAWIALIARLMGDFAIDERPMIGYRRYSGQLSDPAGTVDVDQSPRALRARHAAATALIAERIRSAPEVAWERARADEILARDELLRVRAMRYLSPSRPIAILRLLRRGAYDAYARGWRTALFDLIPRRAHHTASVDLVGLSEEP